MTDNTDDMTEGDAFALAVAEQLPEKMSAANVMSLCSILITEYAEDYKEAGKWVMMITQLVVDKYRAEAAAAGECMCDDCVAARKHNIN